MKKTILQGKRLKVFKLIVLIGYILCTLCLIVESCIEGTSSTKQSNAVGGTIAGIVNDMGGDQTIEVEPKTIYIQNKINAANVGDSISLMVNTEPNNATYQELTYISSDEKLATINNIGKINFLSEGEVTITVFNSKYTSIKDTMVVKITALEIVRIKSNIANAKLEDDVYTLEIGNNYALSTMYQPSNAVVRNNVSYELDTNEYLSIDDKGVIVPLKHSCNNVTQIKVSYTEEIHTYVKVKVKSLSVVDLLSYKVEESISLYPNETKVLNIVAYPENATYSNYKITSSDESILKVKDNLLQGIKPGSTTLVISSIYYKDIVSTISIVVSNYQTINDFILSIDDEDTFYLDEQREINIVTTPSFIDSSTLTYEYDNTYFQVTNNIIKPLKAGTTNLKVTLDGIYKSIDITILNLKEVSDFTPLIKGSETPYLELNEESSIEISYLKNEEHDNQITYKLSNDNVTISQEGIIKANKIGTAVITLNINGISKDIEITIGEPLNIVKTEFNFFSLIKDGEKEYIGVKLTSSKNVDISTLFETNCYDVNNNVISSTILEDAGYTYSIDEEDALLNNNILTIYKAGIYNLNIKHNYTSYQQQVTLLCYNDFDVEYSSSNYLLIGESFNFSLEDDSIYENQEYKVISSNENLIINKTEKKYKITANGEVNEAIISIIPVIDNQEISALKKDITIFFSYKHISCLNLSVYDNNSNEIIDIENKTLTLNKAQSMSLITTTDQDISLIKSISYSSSDNSILSVSNNGLLYPRKIGKVRVTSFDTYTNISDYIDIVVTNKIALDSETPFTITGDKVSYDEEKNIYSLTNGYSAKISVNFSNDTTFNEVNYASSDENIFIVGKDGTITPIKKGKAILTFTIDDQDQSPIKESIAIEIKRQDLISDLNKFFLKCRKAVGHFGAFLVLGIFSTFTALYYFQKKHWKFSLPVNIIQGFFLAAFTEFIQTFVKGRTGNVSDVIIDFSGFLVSTLIIMLIYIIPLLINKHKDKKNKLTN